MGRGMRLACAMVLGGIGIEAGAALKADWSDPGVTTVTDPQEEDFNEPSMDLLEISHVFQDGSHFFRVRSLEAPSQSSFGTYLLNFDWRPGGVDSEESYLVADGLLGIDFIIEAAYIQDELAFERYHWMDESTTTKFQSCSITQVGVTHRVQMDGTQFLQEWEIPSSFWAEEIGVAHGSVVTVYGSTMIVHPWVGRTFDTTSGLSFEVVPEPVAISLILVAWGVTHLLRRRLFP